MEVLLLRLDAPLMSFGGPLVDQKGPTLPFPGRSMLTGLIGNALGYEHADHEALNRLQDRVAYAVRCDRPGARITDFQTVDLGQPFSRAGWTTRGEPEGRGGGSGQSTHIRYREYLADSHYTIALALMPPSGSPTLDEVERALSEPERPLFLGRMACLPASPILLGRVSAGSLVAALSDAPLPVRDGKGERTCTVWVPEDEEQHLADAQRRLIEVADDRDWSVQLHGGRRRIFQSILVVGGTET